MPSRKFVPLAGLALGLLLDPAYAEDNTLELDTISVTSDAYESATGPVDGYRATRSASATKTDTALRDIPQSISVIPATVLKDLGSTSVERALEFAGGVSKQNNFGGLTLYEYSVRGFTTSEFYQDGFSAKSRLPQYPGSSEYRAYRSAQGPRRQPVWAWRSRRHGEYRHQETPTRGLHHAADQRRQLGPLPHGAGCEYPRWTARGVC